MSPPGGIDLTFKVFGLRDMGGEVPADVFAKKINIIVKTLKRVDRISNGSKKFEYVIAGLEKSSAIIDFREKTMSDKPIRVSPALKMVNVGEMISRGTPFSPSDEAEEEIVRSYGKLAKSSAKDFDYATVSSAAGSLIRVDSFLRGQVARILDAAQEAALNAPPRFFTGESFGSFDGIVQAVDLKGDAPEARLILSAGHKAIDCILVGMDLVEVRAALGSRVIVSGRAIYEGKSGLPSRIEIRRIMRIPQSIDKTVFGSIAPVSFDEWGIVQ